MLLKIFLFGLYTSPLSVQALQRRSSLSWRVCCAIAYQRACLRSCFLVRAVSADFTILAFSRYATIFTARLLHVLLQERFPSHPHSIVISATTTVDHSVILLLVLASTVNHWNPVRIHDTLSLSLSDIHTHTPLTHSPLPLGFCNTHYDKFICFPFNQNRSDR
jgi:hypothetical protein